MDIEPISWIPNFRRNVFSHFYFIVSVDGLGSGNSIYNSRIVQFEGKE